MTNTAQSHRERTAGWFPVDTALVVGYVAFMSVLLLGSPSPVAVLVAMPLLFFLPGYALLSVAFPRGRAASDVADAVGHPAVADDARPLSWPGLTAGIASGRLGWRARAALSLGTSVSLLPLIALVLAAAGIGYDTVAVVGSLDLFTVTAMVLGQVRRWRLPHHEQYVVPFRQWWQELTSAFDTATPGDSLVNLVLVVAVVAAMSGVTYALIAPQQGETYTEVALLTDQGGELVAALETDGVDVENLESEFVSWSTMRHHLKGCLDAEKDTAPAATDWETNTVQKAREQTEQKTRSVLSSLSSKQRLPDAERAEVQVQVKLSCPDCSVRVPFEEAVDRGYVCESHFEAESEETARARWKTALTGLAVPYTVVELAQTVLLQDPFVLTSLSIPV